MQAKDFPVHTRVVSTFRGPRGGNPNTIEPGIGTRGTVIGHMLGMHTGQPRVIVLFDGEDYAMNKNPNHIRSI